MKQRMEVERLPASLAIFDVLSISRLSLPDQPIPSPETAAPKLSIRIESSFWNWLKQLGQQNVLRVLAIRRLPSLRPTAD